MQEYVTRPRPSLHEVPAQAAPVIRTIQGEDSGRQLNVQVPQVFPSREARARELLREMEESEKNLENPQLSPGEVQQLGLRIKELGAALEELLAPKGEEFGRRFWSEVLGRNSTRQKADKGYLLQSLSGVRNERVHAMAREALSQGNDELFEVSAAHFAQTRNPAGLKALLVIARDRKNSVTRRLLAVSALGAGTEKGMTEVLEPLLRDPIPRVREATIEALGTTRSPEACRSVINLLYDEAENVRFAAASVCARANCEATDLMVYPHCKSPLPAVRLVAVRALSVPESIAAKERVSSLLKDPSRPVALEAAAKLLSSADEEWGERIAKAAIKMRAFEVMQLIRSISACQSQAARRFIAWAAESSDFDLRMLATEVIERFPSSEGLAALSEQLAHEIWIGQEPILDALVPCRMVDPSKVDALLLAVRPLIDESVHGHWIQAARGTEHPMLRSMLGREIAAGGSHCLSALVALERPRFEGEDRFFASALGADSPAVRTTAALGLLRSCGSFSSAYLHTRDLRLNLPDLLEGAVRELGAGDPKVAEEIISLAEHEFHARRREGATLYRIVPARVLGRFLKMVGVFP